MKKKSKNPVIQSDILLYRKNKFPATLALLGLVFNCLYFCLLYGVKDRTGATKWSQIEIGISVLLTLVVLLVTFLSSEGIKGYNKKYSIPLFVIAAFQIGRIFFFPMYGLKNDVLTIPYFWIYPKTSHFEFLMMVIWLCASAACLIASGVLGIINCMRLEAHMKKVEAGNVDIMAVIREIDAQEEAEKASAPVAIETAEQQTEAAAEAEEAAPAPGDGGNTEVE